MARVFPPELLSHLPTNITPLQGAILDALIKYGYTAQLGPGPGFAPGTVSSIPCRICLERIGNEIALRHTIGPNNVYGEPAVPACGAVFHVTCLISWSEANVHQKSAITCPQDRLLIIPVNESVDLYNRFNLDAIPQHRIRPLNHVIRFWDLMLPNPPISPTFTFDVIGNDPSWALELAANGYDVGLISHNAIARLPLNEEARDRFDQFMTMRHHIPRRQRGNGPRTAPSYSVWIYVQLNAVLIDAATQRFRIDYGFIPVRNHPASVFRRYLLGILGTCYFIDVDENGVLQVEQNELDNQDVISLHAEWETRKLMLQARAMWNTPETVTWYWPFPNYGGGIVMGGILPHMSYPARGFDLDGLNLGHSNNLRFAELADDPAHNAIQQSEDLIQAFREGRLPNSFPLGFELPGYQFATESAEPSPTRPLVVPNARALFPLAQPPATAQSQAGPQPGAFTFSYPFAAQGPAQDQAQDPPVAQTPHDPIPEDGIIHDIDDISDFDDDDDDDDDDNHDQDY